MFLNDLIPQDSFVPNGTARISSPTISMPSVVNEGVDVFSRIWSIVKGQGDPVRVSTGTTTATSGVNLLAVGLMLAVLALVVFLVVRLIRG